MFAQCHSLCFPTPPRSRLVAGRGHSRTANLNWPKGYPIPYNNRFSNKSLGRARRRWELSLPRWPLLRDWLGHQSACGSWWVIAFQLLLYFFFLSAIILSLACSMSFLAFILPILSLIPVNRVGWGDMSVPSVLSVTAGCSWNRLWHHLPAQSLEVSVPEIRDRIKRKEK